ncbi:MAG: hypothetical protein WCD80_13900 [Desulfobaccales bacterium]
MANKKIGCLGLLGIVLLIGFFINMFEQGKKKHDSPEIKSEKNELSQSAPSNVKEKPDPFDSLTPLEHLKIAKEEINKYDFKKGEMGNLVEAKRHLAAISENSPEYKEIKKLEPKIKQLEREIDRQAKIITEKFMVISRKKYAKDYENLLLNNARLDTTITTSGKNNTTLKFKCILVSRVFVNELTKDGKIINHWRSMGFKKIIFTNGYNETWTMNLEK